MFFKRSTYANRLVSAPVGTQKVQGSSPTYTRHTLRAFALRRWRVQLLSLYRFIYSKKSRSRHNFQAITSYALSTSQSCIRNLLGQILELMRIYIFVQIAHKNIVTSFSPILDLRAVINQLVLSPKYDPINFSTS